MPKSLSFDSSNSFLGPLIFAEKALSASLNSLPGELVWIVVASFVCFEGQGRQGDHGVEVEVGFDSGAVNLKIQEVFHRFVLTLHQISPVILILGLSSLQKLSFSLLRRPPTYTSNKSLQLLQVNNFQLKPELCRLLRSFNV